MGDEVWTAMNGTTAELRRVVAVSNSENSHENLFSIYTLQGAIIVNGILASSYDDAEGEWYGFLDNLEERFMYMLSPKLADSWLFRAYSDAWASARAAPLAIDATLLAGALAWILSKFSVRK